MERKQQTQHSTTAQEQVSASMLRCPMLARPLCSFADVFLQARIHQAHVLQRLQDVPARTERDRASQWSGMSTVGR